MEEENCEICGETATHFCDCEMCQYYSSDEDENGNKDELGEGRWICDDCSY